MKKTLELFAQVDLFALVHCYNSLTVIQSAYNITDHISLTDVLQRPTFNLTSSHSAVSPGEAVQFRCASLNRTCVSANFSLYKNGESVETHPAESSATFNLTVDSSDQGQYSCDYSYRGNITSPRSNSTDITVGECKHHQKNHLSTNCITF